MRRWNEFDRPQSRREDHQASSLLRDTVIGAIDNAPFRIVDEIKPFVREDLEKPIEDGIALKFWNVLHGHDVGLQFANEPGEMPE